MLSKCTILLTVIIIGIRLCFSQSFSCIPFPPPTTFNEDRWLLTETTLGGLCNQLGAVFSYLPVARLFRVNLIIGHMFTRHSFEDHWPTPVDKWSTFSFDHLFDWDFFKNYWEARQVSMVLKDSFDDRCRSNNANYASYNITRNPVFGAVDKVRLLRMLHDSSLSNPLPAHSIYQIEAPIKFLTLYNFWRDPELLLEVHRSLQPNAFIRRVVKHLQHVLTTNYIAIHLRLEADYWGHNTTHTLLEVDKAMYWLSTADCLRPYRLSENSGQYVTVSLSGEKRALPKFDTKKLPRVYLASGLFTMKDSSAQTVLSETSRTVRDKVVFYLTAMGLIQDTVWVTQTSLIQSIVEDKQSLNKEGFDLFLYNRLMPEQIAYIDLCIARFAPSGFISSHIGSSFSYMISRMRDWDKGLKLTHREVFREDHIDKHGVSHDFHNWGI